MDIDLLRAVVTVALFVLFVALCVWAWSSRRRADFEEAALLPFDDEEVGAPSGAITAEHTEEKR